MTQPFPFDEIESDRNVCLEKILNAPYDSVIGYIIEVDLTYPEEIKENTETFSNCNEYEILKPHTSTQTKKLIRDSTEKNNYLILYWMLNIYVEHGAILEKIREIISFKQSKWLENYISFNTQKRNRSKNEFEKDFYKLLINAFFGKILENIRNQLKIDIVEKRETDINIKQQSKLTFNGIHKSYTTYNSYTFKKMKFLWINRFILFLLY